MTDTQTATLAEFLLARIAEDEDTARAATPGPWYWEKPSGVDWSQGEESLMSRHQRDGHDVAVLCGWGYDSSGIDAQQADRNHIARHDPSRVLAECEAKRRIVDECTPWVSEPSDDYGAQTVSEMTLRFLALPYADHPDYRQEWRP